MVRQIISSLVAVLLAVPAFAQERPASDGYCRKLFGIENQFDGHAMQAFSVRDSVVYVGYDSGLCRTYELGSGMLISEFPLGCNIGSNHCGNLNFAGSLLYVSGDLKNLCCYVEEVSPGSSRTVQTIRFALSGRHDGSQAVIDVERGTIVYIRRRFSKINRPDNQFLVSEFRLPAVSEGDVTLRDTDVLRSYSLEKYFPIYQGASISGGLLYQSFGGPEDYPSTEGTGYAVFDLRDGSLVSAVRLPLSAEPQSVLHSGGRYYMNFNGLGLYEVPDPVRFSDAGGLSVRSVHIGGYVGGRIDGCFLHRVKGQDAEALVEPFRHREETWRWQSEFWGKWVLGAIGAYRYNRDRELYDKIATSVESLLSTQSPDGYIGNYDSAHQLLKWDIWGRKYVMLGLLSWYDLSGDRRALDAAVRVADHLMGQVGPDRTDIVKTGSYRGMASSSVLEPIMLLYRRTGERRWLDFAGYIVGQWETPDGPGLIDRADIPVARRFPHPAKWFGYDNGQKAYEMMSCYEGLLEYYKATEEERYLDAVKKTFSHILDEEINVAGSGSAMECWYGGKALQTVPTFHTMETCVSFTWMQFCDRLLSLTGDSRYADCIECTFFNAILGSLKDDDSQIAKYTPLEGWRVEGERQCGMDINCCNANGPRAFALIPSLAYRAKGDTLTVNYYGDSEVDIDAGLGRAVKIVQSGGYPVSGDISLEIITPVPEEFTIRLRIPDWSRTTSLRAVSGADTLSLDCVALAAGEYATVSRRWRSGDRLLLNFDMTARLMEQNAHQAIVRGPIVLARDSRYGDGFVDEGVVVKASADGTVRLTPVEGFAWMNFSAPMVTGTDLEGNGKPRQIRLCDFASAGGAWDRSERYRVWLPRTLNVSKDEYRAYSADDGGGLKVISFNIRTGMARDGENAWEHRREATAAMILSERPDILGLQEALGFQSDFIRERCPGYNGVGVGRDDGLDKGERMMIFYRTDSIELLDWGTFWLSGTPERPSLGWDAAYPRCATWALMRHRESGRKFYYVNTHLDHRGQTAQRNGLELIALRIAEINPEGWPAVLTGDFNLEPSDPALNVLEGRMKSARSAAPMADTRQSFNAFGKKDGRTLDYIYYSGFGACTAFSTLTRRYADIPYISDHYPVCAELRF